MRYGISLISLGILLLLLGYFTLPFPININVHYAYTLPPWIPSAKVTVLKGNFTIFTYDKVMEVSEGYSNTFNSSFTILGNGTAIVRGDGIKVFYGNLYEYVSILLIAIGAEIEILGVINERRKPGLIRDRKR